MTIDIDEHLRPRLSWTTASTAYPRAGVARESAMPLAEVWVAGDGRTRNTTSPRQVGGTLSGRLRYLRHHASPDELSVTTHDDETGLSVTSHYAAPGDGAALRAHTSVRNDGREPVQLHLVSSLLLGGLTGGGPGWRDGVTIRLAHNTWFREAQWRAFALADVGLDDPGVALWNAPSSRACFAVTNSGSWSSGGHLPMGALHDEQSNQTWLWQIEHNGPWRWEVGDHAEDLYLLLGGPTNQDHQWATTLGPGDEFVSVPVALLRGDGPVEEAFAALTTYRRVIRRPHPDVHALPVIVNDFMNCLMADPTEAALLPLIDAAHQLGAEYFCIDAGWYADHGGWWDEVGEWQPSSTRFPNGIVAVLDRIRQAGMIPGLWLEPEVVGVRSPVAAQLPDEAFFQRDGRRVVEAERHQLDFRHPGVVAHMDAVVDRIVEEYGVGYLKFDYNIDVSQGTDVHAVPGDGMLQHARAYLAWLDRLLDRYPTLVIENCASGGQRIDYALLARHPIQSITDQQDPLRHAAISAAAPTAVTPEQAASWAYPQPDWDDDLIAFTMVNALLGRMHLSGRIDLLSPAQRLLVIDAVAVYKTVRVDLPTAAPFWPLGLPGWSDAWLALGMTTADGRRYLAVWRRSGPDRHEIPIPTWAGRTASVDCVYPRNADGDWSWDAGRAVLSVHLPAAPQARLFHLRAEPAGKPSPAHQPGAARQPRPAHQRSAARQDSRVH